MTLALRYGLRFPAAARPLWGRKDRSLDARDSVCSRDSVYVLQSEL